MGWLERLSKLFGGTQLGHTGVLLFFVHTSCVLMMSLERLPPANGWQTTLRFYVRRAFRIYPLSTVTLCLVLFFHFPSYMGNNFSPPTWLILVTNFTLTQNLFDHRLLLFPMWSLPLELQMYLVLPLFYFGIKKVGPGRAPQFVLLCWVTAVALIQSRLDVYFKPVEWILYWPCFIAGIFAYTQWSRRRAILPWPTWPVFLFSICYAFQPRQPLLIFGGCLILGALLPWFREIDNRPLNQITSWIARYSYAIYLIHVPIFHFFFWEKPVLPTAMANLAALSSLGFLSWLLYHLIERPMIALGVRLTEPNPKKLAR